MVDKDDKTPSILSRFNKNDLKSLDKLDQIFEGIEEVSLLYYSNYTVDRNKILKDKILEIVKILDDYLSNINQFGKKEMAFIYFSKTYLLDKLPEYSKIAEESANKSLKLNPFIADSYNCIAHILWKKGDINLAQNYFNQAYELDSKDKATLRNLSMITRAIKTENSNEKTSNAEISLKYAKEAVNVDIKDSESWCKLINM